MSEKEDQVIVISQVGVERTDVRKLAEVIADYIVAPVAKEFKLRMQRSDRDPTPVLSLLGFLDRYSRHGSWLPTALGRTQMSSMSCVSLTRLAYRS